MDINQLPLEVLQKILANLSYGELMVASMVSHRWNQASEMFIVPISQFCISKSGGEVATVELVRNSTRNYQSVVIARTDKWELLQAAVSECIQRFPNARNLYMAGGVQDYLGRLYQANRNWMQRLESLRVTLGDRPKDFVDCGPKDYILALPNLKQLEWMDLLLYKNEQKTVTIDAPGLEYADINDSLGASIALRILYCERLKHIRSSFYTKNFEDTFAGDCGQVETLILNMHRNCSISSLSKMPHLRYLSLRFRETFNLREVEEMPSSPLLKVLSIRIDVWSATPKLNLKKVFSRFENLEKLELCRINLEENNSIQAAQLVFLKLRGVTCPSSILLLNAPKLKTLSLNVDMLKLHFLRLTDSQYLSELYVDLGVSILNNSFEQIICPFLQEHRHIKNLTLIRESSEENPVLDDVIHDRIAESVDHLELHRFDVNINFFRLLSRWKLPKSLKLSACTINCGELQNNVVRLPGVERMIIDCVRLRGTWRNDFPILLDNGVNEEVILNERTRSFSTKKIIHKNKSQPYPCPEIDPILTRPHSL